MPTPAKGKRKTISVVWQAWNDAIAKHMEERDKYRYGHAFGGEKWCASMARYHQRMIDELVASEPAKYE